MDKVKVGKVGKKVKDVQVLGYKATWTPIESPGPFGRNLYHLIDGERIEKAGETLIEYKVTYRFLFTDGTKRTWTRVFKPLEN
jgi:hypothetical protein